MQLSFVDQRRKVTELPLRERPAYRLRFAGPGAISNAELLAVVLGTPSGLYQAQELLVRFDGMAGIARASEQELSGVDGIGPALAARIRAAFEIGVRATSAAEARPQVKSPDDAAQLVMGEMGLSVQEELRAILLDTKNYVTGIETIYRGNANTNLIRSSEVFRPAVTRNAVSVIIVHNHPSGDPTPSPEDVAVTKKLIAAGQELEIEVLDHIIVGQGCFVSMKEYGLGW